jgi:hypothetical protein
VVATGGARGVTAAAMRLLASRYRPRMVLLGRTPLVVEPAGLSAATDEPGLVHLLASRQPGGAQPEPDFAGGEHPRRFPGGAQPEPDFGGGEHAPRHRERAQPEPVSGGGEHG